MKKGILFIFSFLIISRIMFAGNLPSKTLNYLIGDGVTDQTIPLQNAIDSCSKAGGGTLIIPKGTYVISPITMNSNVNLYIDTLATLLATSTMANYTVNGSLLNLIGGDSLHNVSITGKGTIDGNGAAWWAAYNANTSISRPRLVYLTKVLNLTIDGITLLNSPSFHIVPNQCKNVIINNVTISAPSTSPNTDGIDPSNCIDVYITNCTIGDGDDNIAVKGNRINGVLSSAGACQNINISGCTFLSGHGLSIGSETDDGVTNLTAKNCTFNGTTNGIRIKSATGLGGPVTNVRYTNMKMTNVENPIIITLDYTSKTGTYPTDIPSVNGFYIDSLTATGATGAAGSIVGLSNSILQNISLKNVSISAKTGLVLTDASGVTLCNVVITPSSGQPIIATNVQYNPDTISTISASSTSLTASKVTWTVPCLSQVVEYGVFRSYDGKTFTLLNQIAGTVTNYQYQYADNAVNTCQPVYYKVGSYSAGNSDTLWSAVTMLVNAASATITPATTTTFCSGGSVVLNANTGTGYTYQWYNGTAITGATSASYTASTSGNYTVTVKINSNCSATSTVTIVTVNALPSAPSVTSSVTYCQNATATVLTATGTSLKWYTVATGGTASTTAPTPVTTTAGNMSYYVSQTITGCEGPRAAITVIVNTLPLAPTVANSVIYHCQNSTVSALSATGSSLLWYTVATGGTGNTTAPTPSTITVGTTIYYVSQTTNVCESARTAITVTVNLLPGVPTVTSPVMYCQNTRAIALNATGTSLKWYTVATGGTSSTTVPIPVTTTSGNTSYYVSQTTNGCEGPRATITVTVNPLPAVSITTPSGTAFCSGGSIVLTSSAATSYTWLKSNTPVGGSSQNYTASSVGSYRIVVTNGSGCSDTSSAVSVTQTTQNCKDCAGVMNGTAYTDSCGNCVGGTTGLTACSITTGTVSYQTSSLLVYPQPFEQSTRIELKNGLIESITIYSSTGSLVYSQAGIGSTEVETGENLSDGLYTVIVQSQQGIYTCKIVKRK